MFKENTKNKIYFTKEQIQGCYSSENFYEMIGMTPLFKDKKITCVSQMKISQVTFESILKILEENYKKHKKLKMYRTKYAKNIINFDWHNYSPLCSEEVEDWCIEYNVKEE